MRGHDPHGEQGAALLTAIVLTAVMLAIGLATFSFADGRRSAARAAPARDGAEPDRGGPLQPGLRARPGMAGQRRRRRADPRDVHVGLGPDAVPGTATRSRPATRLRRPLRTSRASTRPRRASAGRRASATTARRWPRRSRLRRPTRRRAPRTSRWVRLRLRGALPLGCQRRPQAVGAGARGRRRASAQRGRAAQARAVLRALPAQHRDRRQLRDDQQGQQADPRRAGSQVVVRCLTTTSQCTDTRRPRARSCLASCPTRRLSAAMTGRRSSSASRPSRGAPTCPRTSRPARRSAADSPAASCHRRSRRHGLRRRQPDLQLAHQRRGS